MAKGTKYTPEFKAKAVRLLTESRGSYSSETKAVEQVARDLGGGAGDAAPLARRDGRHGRGGDQEVSRGSDGGVEEFAGRGRAIEARGRDIDDGVGFFRGTARPGTALMAACVDEFKDRFRVGPGREKSRHRRQDLVRLPQLHHGMCQAPTLPLHFWTFYERVRMTVENSTSANMVDSRSFPLHGEMRVNFCPRCRLLSLRAVLRCRHKACLL